MDKSNGEKFAEKFSQNEMNTSFEEVSKKRCKIERSKNDIGTQKAESHISFSVHVEYKVIGSCEFVSIILKLNRVIISFSLLGNLETCSTIIQASSKNKTTELVSSLSALNTAKNILRSFLKISFQKLESVCFNVSQAHRARRTRNGGNRPERSPAGHLINWFFESCRSVKIIDLNFDANDTINRKWIFSPKACKVINKAHCLLVSGGSFASFPIIRKMEAKIMHIETENLKPSELLNLFELWFRKADKCRECVFESVTSNALEKMNCKLTEISSHDVSWDTKVRESFGEDIRFVSGFVMILHKVPNRIGFIVVDESRLRLHFSVRVCKHPIIENIESSGNGIKSNANSIATFLRMSLNHNE